MRLNYKNYTVIIILVLALSLMAGCASQTPYFKLDNSLQNDIKNFSGFQYVPLSRLCDVYGFECQWDSYIKTAILRKGSHKIVIRTDSDRVLVDGSIKKASRPVLLDTGAVYVPISFVREDLAQLIKSAPIEKPPVLEEVRKYSIKTIVLDPGHGGKDPGAIGRRGHLKEKDVTLRLARKIKDVLEASGVRVIMTRDSDVFIPLPKRADIANKSGADLFVSVHINASRSRLMRGFECYHLSNATDDNARVLEAFEDSSLRMGEGAEAEHSSQLDKALWDMALTENRLESAELASYVCDSVDQSFTISNKGIKSARFYVLKHTHIPAVLLEAGYISNRYEEAKLKDPSFIDKLASAIGGGILKYKREYERTEGFTKK